MSRIVSVRFSQPEFDFLEKLATENSCLPSSVLKRVVYFLSQNPSVVEEIFAGGGVMVKSDRDFLIQLGAHPFYGCGRTIFYRFSHKARECLILSVSRTLSRGETLIVTIDGRKVDELNRICTESKSELDGYVAVRFRLSADDPWKFFLASVSDLNSSPFTYSSATGNFFLHLKKMKSTNILLNLEQLQTKLEDLV